MDMLLDGYRRFREDTWPHQRKRYQDLATGGQRPPVMVIACSDSRVDPATIFSAAPGEIFTVRNVANLVPPHETGAGYHGTSAALEFGVRVLKVEHLVVLGHGLCGGVRALLEGPPEDSDFVGAWISIAEPARRCAMRHDDPDARQTACEHETIRLSLRNLMTFPWIRDAVQAKQLTLHGAWFDIHTGTLLELGPDDEFRPVPAQAP
jgi:carbonic anhydrase